jgi:threonine aldolase
MTMRVDLRSDTVTRPTPAMRRAMAEAEVGDDVFGDDPTVRLLEEETAALLGKEAGLFVPSGTMGNQISVAVHTERGDEVICEATCHIFLYEGGGPALLSGVQLHPLTGERGLITLEQLRGAVRDADVHFPVSRLLCLENTHNRAGGRVLPLAALETLTAGAKGHGLKTHLDGARIWNAAAASGIAEDRWASSFDSVQVCYSKGLGAPVGSCVTGTRVWVERARHYRKRFGGGMRQAGIIAAGALHALRHHRARLAEDHARAGRLAAELAGLPGFAVDPAETETNIVVARLAPGAASPQRWVDALRARGVAVVRFGPSALRMVTHLDVDDDALDFAVRAVREVAQELGRARDGSRDSG